MRGYITSAHGHELSGRVRAHAYTRGLQSKLLITPLKLMSEAIILLYCRYGAL